MLNEEESLRVQAILGVVDQELRNDLSVSESIHPQTIEWLAQKLKEADDAFILKEMEFRELQRMHNEIDRMLATALYVIDNAELMSEYLKLRNQ